MVNFMKLFFPKSKSFSISLFIYIEQKYAAKVIFFVIQIIIS
jgi:hypothetical protein